MQPQRAAYAMLYVIVVCLDDDDDALFLLERRVRGGQMCVRSRARLPPADVTPRQMMIVVI